MRFQPASLPQFNEQNGVNIAPRRTAHFSSEEHRRRSRSPDSMVANAVYFWPEAPMACPRVAPRAGRPRLGYAARRRNR